MSYTAGDLGSWMSLSAMLEWFDLCTRLNYFVRLQDHCKSWSSCRGLWWLSTVGQWDNSTHWCDLTSDTGHPFGKVEFRRPTSGAVWKWISQSNSSLLGLIATLVLNRVLDSAVLHTGWLESSCKNHSPFCCLVYNTIQFHLNVTSWAFRCL